MFSSFGQPCLFLLLLACCRNKLKNTKTKQEQGRKYTHTQAHMDTRTPESIQNGMQLKTAGKKTKTIKSKREGERAERTFNGGFDLLLLLLLPAAVVCMLHLHGRRCRKVLPPSTHTHSHSLTSLSQSLKLHSHSQLPSSHSHSHPCLVLSSSCCC